MKLNTLTNKKIGELVLSPWVIGIFIFLGYLLPMNVLAATAHLRENAPNLIEKTEGTYGELIGAAALLHDVDPKLILAVIIVESEGNANVVSRRGAQGLMQLMPKTAKAMGAENSKDPRQNILAGTRYLKELEERYGYDSFEERLLAYNMGPQGAKRWLLKHPPEEYGYVENVMYVYYMLVEEEKEKIRLAEDVMKKFADQDVFYGLRSFFTRPSALSLASFPMTLPSERRQDILFGD